MKQENNLRIIVIDDNPAIHQDFIKILMMNKRQSMPNEELTHLEQSLFGQSSTLSALPKFEIDTASQGKEGTEKIAKAIQEKKPYALAFVDIRMPPGWDGVETINHIWKLDPDIQVVICTAYSDYTWEEMIEQLGQRDNLLILKKPFDNIAVRQLACALTKKWKLAEEAKQYTHTLKENIEERTKSLKKSLSLMRATLESSADGVLVIDNQGKISDFNQKFVDMGQIPSAVMEANNFQVLIEYITSQVEPASEFVHVAKSLTANQDSIVTGNIKFKDQRHFEFYTQPYTMDNQIIGRVWNFHDTTQRTLLEKKLQFQATHDLLTSLPNRVLLLDRIRQAMEEANENNAKVAILFLDLDRFKLINDSINHEAGDAVLRIVSTRLKKVMSKQDTLARLGGDEFVIVLKNIKDKNSVLEFCHQLLDVFKTPFKVIDYEFTLTTSIGVCFYPEDGVFTDVLLRNADTAMYAAKESGNNQINFYTEELNKKNLERFEMENELRNALKNEEFFLVFQPQFDLSAQKLVSVEALIRWNHPQKGVILPINFIPLAEDMGLIVPIGEWVLRKACQQVKAWQEAGLPFVRVAVNVATKQFRFHNLVQTITDILNETGLEAKYLELELTENMIINNADIVNAIYDLNKLGVYIALDDFGSGCSSLNYLRKLPVDRLKIDQSYVQNIESTRGDHVIIQAIITMAKSMNLEVLAEGVETQKQLEFLQSRQCGEVQGYYFSKPLSTEDCQKLLADPHQLSFTEGVKSDQETTK